MDGSTAGFSVVFSMSWISLYDSEIKSYLPLLLHDVFYLPALIIISIALYIFLSIIIFYLRKARVINIIDDKYRQIKKQ